MRFCLICIVFIGLSVSFLKPASAQDGEEYLSVLLNTDAVLDTAAWVSMNAEESVDADDREDSWHEWELVENYTYGKDRGAIPMIADLNSLHPYFRDRVMELLDAARGQGIELAVVESFRTHAKQAEYFGMGRKYTRSKGGNSKHQYGLAVDVVPMVGGKAIWDNQPLWRKIGMIGERLGLRWGGRWRAPYDPAHFEWSGGITTMQLAKGYLPAIPRSKSSMYPCIDDEMARLQQNWEAWEVEQSAFAKNAFKTASRNGGATGQRP